jgi:hypothetical protein
MIVLSLYNISTEQKCCVGNNNFSDCNEHPIKWSMATTLVIAISLFAALSFSLSLDTNLQLMNARAAVDIDASGGGRAAASDGEENIATDGDSFCSITDDIAGSRFSSLFEGIVNCDNSSQAPNQFSVEYSYTKNPVKIGEKTYLTITVRDKSTGDPISNAFVKLAIEPTPPLPSHGAATALAAATTSAQEVVEDKTIQTAHTDKNGRATFTIQLGPKSDKGIYDTEIDVRKDTYQSSFEQVNLRVV